MLLVGLIVAATAAFIVGTTIERNSGEKQTERAAAPAAEPSESGETPGAHSEAAGGESGHKETHPELRPLGIDIEAAPFVALAAAASLLLALGVWLRPRWLLLLALVVAAMLVFAVLDVREIFHQSDESRTGLAVLAAFVALLHLGAATAAGAMGREARP
jgi:Flp pilus assembly protein TadB